MEPDARQFLRLLEGALVCEHEQGNCTPLEEHHTTIWRTMGCTLFAQIVGGHGLMEITGRGAFVHRDRAVVCVRGGLHHRGSKRSAGPAVSRWSHVQARVFGSVDVFALLEPPVIIDGSAGEEIGEINARLAELRDHPEAVLAAAIERRALLARLLLLATRDATPAPRCMEMLRAAERLAPALALIEREFASPRLGLDALARAAGLARSRFHAVFSSAFALSPIRYLRRRRLERGCQLLVGSDLPVRVVAERVGFEDQFHFSHAFKRTFGRSPSAYRAAVRGVGA